LSPDRTAPSGPDTYLVINRFDDEFGEYHRFLPPEGARIAYITTEHGLKPLATEHALEVRVVPDLGLKTLLPIALEMSGRWGGFLGVVGLSEWDVLTAAHVREQLDVPGYRPSFVSRFRDKPLMKQLVAAAGLRAPRYQLLDGSLSVDELVATVGLPMIVKPRAGAASTGVRRIDTGEALREVLEGVAGEGIQCEEFIAGDIFHVDGIRRDDEFYVVTVSAYVNTCLDFAGGSPLGSVLLDPGPNRTEILGFAESCLKALGLSDGPFHLELFRSTTGELVFLEVGLRPGGAEVPFLHRDLLGVDLFGEAFRVTLGLPPFFPCPLPDLEGSGGWLIFPEPRPLPSRVVSATSLRSSVPEIYSERIPSPGEVFDGTGVYDHVGGSFRLRGADEATVRRAIDRIMANYAVVAEAATLARAG